MRNWGLLLLVIGLGSFVLPYFGFQFQLINLFGEDSQPAVALILAAAGAILFFAGSAKERKTSTAATAAPPPQKAPDPTVKAEPKEQQRSGLHCSACGAENSAEARFCGSCGASLIPAAPLKAQTCARCGATLVASDRFCSACGAPLGAPPETKPTPRRRGGRSLLILALVGIGIIGGVLWGTGLLPRIGRINVPQNPTSRPSTDISSQTRPNTPPRAASVVLNSAWVSPDLLDEQGWLGLRIYASFSASGLRKGRLVVRLFDSAGAPLKGSSGGPLEVSAPFSLDGTAGTAATQDLSVFLAYEQLGLAPGSYTLQVLPNILDDQGNLLAKGSFLTFAYQQNASSITQVQVTPDHTDASGSQGVLVTASFISEPLDGPQGAVMVHFKDPAGGHLLPGQQPYIDANGNLTTWQSYDSPAIRSRYFAFQLFLPYSVLPPDIHELDATISLYDPTRSVFLTPFVPFRITLP